MMGELNWNLLDTTMPAKVGASFDLAGAYNKGIKSANQNRVAQQKLKMNELTLQNAQTTQAKNLKVQNILAQSGGNINEAIPKIMQVDPEAGMKLQEMQQKKTKQELDNKAKLHTISMNSADTVASAPAGMVKQVALQQVEEVAKMTNAPPQLKAQAIQHIEEIAATQGEEGLRQEAIRQSMSSKDYLSQQHQQATLNETIRGHDMTNANAAASRAVSIRGQNMSAKKAAEAAKQKQNGRPHVAQLMADGWYPSTRITNPQLDAIEAAATAAEAKGKKLTVDDLYSMEFGSVKNRSTGRASGSRQTLNRAQNIEAAYGLLDDMKVTSEKLDYSDTKFLSVLDKWKRGQVQDPALTEYMAQRADSLFVLGNALKQNGLTDKAIQVEEEAAHPTMSKSAFLAYYNTQIRALNRAAKGMNKDFKSGIKLREAAPAGSEGVMPQNAAPAPPTNTISVVNPATGETEVWDLTTEKRIK